MSWDTWRAGVAEAYRLKKELDKRAAAGEVLFKHERQTHERVSDIVSRYYASGRKKPGVKRRREHLALTGAAVVSLGLVANGLASPSEADELMESAQR